ncbi:hypothetical protein Dda3937_04357 [Dickeya dadantii 3937]|uniref:Uncharacterized protein n=1 Tax=Dickeya dadantii (strain 3937) TaxID=198628 RepID=E0SKI6_DICD3|nr:hypothetical protein Dda3937_04357 [Dickeya dadantii 3937]
MRSEIYPVFFILTLLFSAIRLNNSVFYYQQVGCILFFCGQDTVLPFPQRETFACSSAITVFKKRVFITLKAAIIL